MKKLLVLLLLYPLIVLGQVDTTPTKKEPSKFSQGMKKILFRNNVQHSIMMYLRIFRC